MKINIEESKRIRAELNKINERSNQICRILDKDDIDINFINDIGKKKHTKTTINNNILPNLIYYQGKINNKENYAKTFYNKFHKKKKNLILNDFHSNFFKILKGNENEKIIKTFFYSENYPHHNNKIDIKAKKEKERKLKLIAPELLEKKRIMMERLPLNYKKYRKNYEYKNNQVILDEMNEQRYKKYDEPFKYPLDEIYSNEVLPKYNNLFFKYEKNKIRDYFYRKTMEKYNSKYKNNKFQSNVFGNL
jgi:hypothetical protein